MARVDWLNASATDFQLSIDVAGTVHTITRMLDSKCRLHKRAQLRFIDAARSSRHAPASPSRGLPPSSRAACRAPDRPTLGPSAPESKLQMPRKDNQDFSSATSRPDVTAADRARGGGDCASDSRSENSSGPAAARQHSIAKGRPACCKPSTVEIRPAAHRSPFAIESDASPRSTAETDPPSCVVGPGRARGRATHNSRGGARARGEGQDPRRAALNFIPFSAFWLRSSVVSVLTSLITCTWFIEPF